ncbi:RagB/SusD family nutrient uptake outer membrane protein [Olivibacter sp. SDN3]|uniref:RagB/SusD family nutrient uptake outer membrane protein n=1 Tax=Olivibacter sp. SDN3 TaxID=2764720 RepID=UPI0016510FB1|nr:RagB/SusD family nutrient uptake outer membrane protein [Olivibacter sp. SDN3]QNL49280.1 RagB/SusD family nutrient uptake outer membrane protein [Olivibacter sp. SDN3]
MKTRLYLYLSILFFAGCSKTLEEVPSDRLSEEIFYQTAQDAEAAVNAIYEPFRELSYYGGFYMLLTESCSDYANGRGSFAPVSEYNGLDGANIARAESMWTLAYRAILRANTVLDKVPTIEMDENDKAGLLAEARFLRAVAYFDLVRNFGGVPLRQSIDDPTDLPRSSTEEIYQFIIADLESAANDLPNVPSIAGRPNNLAAKTLLAYVYLTLEDWEMARDLSGEVIDAGRYQLVPVVEVEDFENLFGAGVINSSEEVFSFKYSSAGGQGFEYLVYIHGENTLYAPYGFRTIYAREIFPLIADWSDEDLRKEFNLYDSYIHRNSGATVQLPSNEPYQFRKFKDYSSVASDASANDMPVLRYADVLLIYAESASQAAGGPTPEAYEAINQVRRRAYGKAIHIADATVDLTGLDQVGFREAVFEERAYEFMVEGKRWNDLKRLGNERVKAIIQEAKGRAVSDSQFLWPIPRVEMDNNNALDASDQNPGY